MSHSKSPKKEVIQYLYHMDCFFKGKPKPETIGFLPSRKWGVRLKFSHQYFMVTNQPGLGSSLHFMVPSGNLLHSY